MNVRNLSLQVALALSAGSSLIYEVVATEIMFFFFTRSSYSVATILSVFLFGLGAGSFMVYLFSRRIRDEKIFFGALQILVALYSFFILANLREIIPHLSTLGTFFASFAILLIPTMSLGAIFPLAGSLFMPRDENIKETIGFIYSSDMIGAICGSLVAGFLLIPTYGLRVTALFGVASNLLSAFVILPRRMKLIPILFLISFLLVLSAPTLPGLTETHAGAMPPVPSTTGIVPGNVSVGNTPGGMQGTDETLLFSGNSPYGLVEVDRSGTLYVNGKEQCGLDYPNTSSQRMMADYALGPLNNPHAEVLNIGLGCGLTLSRVLQLTDRTVDVVEINPVVVDANRNFTDVLDNSRVNLTIGDGLAFMRTSGRKYDSILIDVEEPSVAHSSPLFTVEAFMMVNRSLKEQGTFALWDYQAFLTLNQTKFMDILYYSLKTAFPHVYQYRNVFVASNHELNGTEYVPSTGYEVNTIDRNTLEKAYIEGGGGNT